MTTKLTMIGDALHLIIEPSMLEGLKIDRNTPLDVTTDGTGLYIRPAKSNDQDQFVESARRMMKIHAETFRKLAE